ncbi:MAG: hypothetical protein U5K54_04165 [Cytophagales bacterium]|nr:hypothetical protein [Cytophagales bacterium]
MRNCLLKMIAPRWLKTGCQPIGIRNVIEYLQGVMLKPETFNQSFDIGGADILTYKQMLLEYAAVRNLKRISSPFPYYLQIYLRFGSISLISDFPNRAPAIEFQA